MKQQKHSSKIKAFILILIAGVLVFNFWECPLQSFCGIPCPGCNMTTALYYVLHLDFNTAFYYHPLVFILLFGVIIELFLYIKYKNFTNIYSKIIFYVFVILLILVYIIRMIIIFPSSPMVYVEDNFIRNLFTLFF